MKKSMKVVVMMLAVSLLLSGVSALAQEGEMEISGGNVVIEYIKEEEAPAPAPAPVQSAEPTPSVEENKPEPTGENTPASTDGEAEGTEPQGGEATSGDESAEPVDTTDNTNEANGEGEPIHRAHPMLMEKHSSIYSLILLSSRAVLSTSRRSRPRKAMPRWTPSGPSRLTRIAKRQSRIKILSMACSGS